MLCASINLIVNTIWLCGIELLVSPWAKMYIQYCTLLVSQLCVGVLSITMLDSSFSPPENDSIKQPKSGRRLLQTCASGAYYYNSACVTCPANMYCTNSVANTVPLGLQLACWVCFSASVFCYLQFPWCKFYYSSVRVSEQYFSVR